MKEYPSQALLRKHGMIWSGSLKIKKTRNALVGCFLRLLRYDIMDCQQGGNAFD